MTKLVFAQTQIMLPFATATPPKEIPPDEVRYVLDLLEREGLVRQRADGRWGLTKKGKALPADFDFGKLAEHAFDKLADEKLH
jgi:hypothetical protein